MSDTISLKHLIGGEWVDGKAGIESLNPSDTRDVVAHAPSDDGTAMRAAIEAADHGVRINAVAPSLAIHAHLAKVTTVELLQQLTTQEAFGRAAEPWEVANVIVFLASDYSTYMTGEVVSVSSQHP